LFYPQLKRPAGDAKRLLAITIFFKEIFSTKNIITVMCLVFFAGFSQKKHVFFHSHLIVVLAESGNERMKLIGD